MPVALVTGASRGIGLATSELLASRGWHVVAAARDTEDLAGLSDRHPGRITATKLDVTDDGDIAGLDAALPERVDAVVNNAGIAIGGPIESTPLEEVRRQLEVNVVGQIGVTQALLPRLRESRGRIVFVSSTSGRVSVPMTGVYNASKHAIEAIADAWRLELRRWGIKVSIIEPGAIDTDIWRKVDETFNETLARTEPHHQELYADHLDALRETTSSVQTRTTPVEKVAEAIENALTSKRPKARTLVGTDAYIQMGIKKLPTPAADWAFGKFTGTPEFQDD